MVCSAIGLGDGGTVGLGVGSAVGLGDGGTVGLGVGSTVGLGVGSSVGLRVGSAVGLGVGGGVGFKVGSGVGIKVGSAVGIKVGSAVGIKVGRAVGFWVTSSVGTGSKVGKGSVSSLPGSGGTTNDPDVGASVALGDLVGTTVGVIVVTIVGVGTGATVGDTVVHKVGVGTGAIVGDTVDPNVGVRTGAMIGATVTGTMVGATVGEAMVGATVAGTVGATVNFSVGMKPTDGATVGGDVMYCMGNLVGGIVEPTGCSVGEEVGLRVRILVSDGSAVGVLPKEEDTVSIYRRQFCTHDKNPFIVRTFYGKGVLRGKDVLLASSNGDPPVILSRTQIIKHHVVPRI